MIKTNVVKTDIGSYVHYIRGVKKSGKSTLFRDLVLKLFNNDEKKGLLISFGDEDGYKSLDKLQFEAIEHWDMDENEKGERGFVQLVDDLVENNDKYGIKMLAYDTIDKLIDVATNEVLKQSMRETGQVCKSLNEAFGGWARGKERLIRLIQEQTFRLKKIGLNPFVLGHTKYKDITDKITSEEYSQLTGSLTSDLDGIFADTAQMVVTISLDKIIKDNAIVGVERVMHFRDDGLYDCGSRFPGLPEKLPLSAENYISAFEQGVKASFLTPVTDKDIEKQKKEEVKEREVESKDNAKKEEMGNAIKKVKGAMKKGLADKKMNNDDILNILSKYSLKTPDSIPDIATAKNILSDLKAVYENV